MKFTLAALLALAAGTFAQDPVNIEFVASNGASRGRFAIPPNLRRINTPAVENRALGQSGDISALRIQIGAGFCTVRGLNRAGRAVTARNTGNNPDDFFIDLAQFDFVRVQTTCCDLSDKQC
ncbi:hypothetical protein M409DRAFT_24617 [Zasmidium cellare ATCC 36951]|uniref:Uncharacterized protein n=1 Tax=Zasmidium cellare ATCC 36951 TaxID=1080233 RepID=A0A6A6CDH0_ZASCE|nr:uncharacterized protein M409DRAFT_24617 [Zasmidium cellare ATCC 36951]KAF2165234.1 hypothetical protein M409DRAFT_24617 [Zasmidium cellare ATCC 36951]